MICFTSYFFSTLAASFGVGVIKGNCFMTTEVGGWTLLGCIIGACPTGLLWTFDKTGAFCYTYLDLS